MCIRYGFNRQLSALCQSLCYLAFGVNLPTNQHTTNTNTLNNKEVHVGYESEIAAQLYEHYREDGFKYAEPGITPKGIAQQIQVHMKKAGDLQWVIDQFGRFMFLPTPTYLHNITANLMNKHQYQHILLAQTQQILKLKQYNHYFDYYISKYVTVSELRKLINMQYKARVLERINGHRVIRTVFSAGQQVKTVQRIANMIFRQTQYKIQPVTNIFNTNRQLNHNSDYQYINCNGQDTIHMQKQLPNHILLNSYLGNQPNHIHKLTNLQLKHQLSQPPQRLTTTNQPILQKYKQKLSMGDVIVMYGNLLDSHQFHDIDRLFGEVKLWEMGKLEEIKVLEDSHRRLLDINFQ